MLDARVRKESIHYASRHGPVHKFAPSTSITRARPTSFTLGRVLQPRHATPAARFRVTLSSVTVKLIRCRMEILSSDWCGLAAAGGGMQSGRISFHAT